MQKDLLRGRQGHSLSQPCTITSHCAFGIQSFTNNTLADFEMHVKYYLTFVIWRRDHCEGRNALDLKHFLGHVHLRRENTQQLRSKQILSLSLLLRYDFNTIRRTPLKYLLCCVLTNVHACVITTFKMWNESSYHSR